MATLIVNIRSLYDDNNNNDRKCRYASIFSSGRII